MKSEVYALGGYLGINKNIIEAAPTDGLWGDDRTDEDQIGASYDELEWAMTAIDQGLTENLNERQLKVMAIYKRLHQANSHKMVPIPVCEVSEAIKK